MFEKLLEAIATLTAAIAANTAAQLGAKVVTKAADKGTPAAAKPEAPKPEAPKVETPATVTYDAVKVPFLALVEKNRDAALECLKPYGYDNLKVAKPEHFAAILKAVNEATAKHAQSAEAMA